MKKKELIVWMFFVVAVLAVLTNTTVAQEQTPQQQKTQNEQLKQIDKYILRQHQQIENYYRVQLIELTHRAKADVRLLEVAHKPEYAGLRAWAHVAETVLHINSYENGPYGYFKVTTETPPKRFAVALSRIAERKSDILSGLEWEAANLEQQKKYALTVTLVELEKRLKENALRAKPKPTRGLVTGLVYSDKPSAIIDGEIVHEGDTIHGVKVLKIYRDKVEFVKNSNRWKQKVQQTPEAYWK